ncbi:MAG: hypothetical protein B7Z33_13890, partial [Sphingomonadales bacterium 12-68-11]
MTGRFAHLLPPEPFTDAELLNFAFRERPVFRTSFDHHVRQLDRLVRTAVWRAYNSRPGFAAAYDQRLQDIRSMPLPPWKARAA